jgi:hypothetical protein
MTRCSRVAILAVALPANIVQLHSQTRTPALEPVPASVERYWEWTAYWDESGLSFPGTRYRAGESVRAIIFVPAPDGNPFLKWGFCSNQLGVCHAYVGYDDGTVNGVDHEPVRAGESGNAALARLLWDKYGELHLEDDQGPANGPPSLVIGPMPERRRPPKSSASADLERRYKIKIHAGVFVLPRVRLPEAIRLRTANRLAEDEVRRIQARHNLTTGCTIVVPYADQSYLLVPVLFECAGGRSLQLLSKGIDYWYPTVGGSFGDGPVIAHYGPKIWRNASLILRGAPKPPARP